MDDEITSAQWLLASTNNEITVSRILIAIASIFSLVSTLSMIGYFIVFEESRRCGRRILFGLHLADAGAAVSWLLTLALPSTASGTTSSLCMSQGYMLVFFMMASYLWTACFAFHLYQILGRRYKCPELFESRYHVLAWGIPATTILQLGLQQMGGFTLIGESGHPWCFFRTFSDYEWSTSGFYAQLAIFYIPVLLIFLHNIVTYIALLYKLGDVLSTRMEDKIWYRMMMYTWVFFLTFVWSSFALLYQAISEDHTLSSLMLYFMSFFVPLQGTMNALAYGVNAKFRSRVEQGVEHIRQRYYQKQVGR